MSGTGATAMTKPSLLPAWENRYCNKVRWIFKAAFGRAQRRGRRKRKEEEGRREGSKLVCGGRGGHWHLIGKLTFTLTPEGCLGFGWANVCGGWQRWGGEVGAGVRSWSLWGWRGEWLEMTENFWEWWEEDGMWGWGYCLNTGENRTCVKDLFKRESSANQRWSHRWRDWETCPSRGTLWDQTLDLSC